MHTLTILPLFSPKLNKFLHRRTDRATHQGLIGLRITNNSQTAIMVEVNCETDFVAKAELFRTGMATYLETLAQAQNINLDFKEWASDDTKSTFLKEKLTRSFDPDLKEMTAEEGLKYLISKTRENCTIGGVVRKNVSGTKRFGSYLHGSVDKELGKTGVIVLVDGDNQTADYHPIANVIAMHIAAMRPKYLSREAVPEDAGKVQENEILLDQELVSPNNIKNYTVRDYLVKEGEGLGAKITVEDFVVFSCV